MGLLPGKRGPRRPHKITPEVARFIEQTVVRGEELAAQRRVERIAERFGLVVHQSVRSGLGNHAISWRWGTSESVAKANWRFGPARADSRRHIAGMQKKPWKNTLSSEKSIDLARDGPKKLLVRAFFDDGRLSCR
jgi:hypothetical protein